MWGKRGGGGVSQLTGQLLHPQFCAHWQEPALAQEQEPEELQEHAIFEVIVCTIVRVLDECDWSGRSINSVVFVCVCV